MTKKRRPTMQVIKTFSPEGTLTKEVIKRGNKKVEYNDLTDEEKKIVDGLRNETFDFSFGGDTNESN